MPPKPCYSLRKGFTNPATEHGKQLVGGGTECVPHEASGLKPARRLDSLADRWFAMGTAPRKVPHACFIACRWPVAVYAEFDEFDESINFAKQLAHLVRRVAQRHRPQPLLQARHRSMRLWQQASPVIKRHFAECVDKAPGQRRFSTSRAACTSRGVSARSCLCRMRCS